MLSKRDLFDLKKQYRELRDLKRQYPKGNEKRIELNKQMKELKKKIEGQNINNIEVSKEKDILMRKIKLLTPDYLQGLIDLRQYTEAQLQLHYNNLLNNLTKKV